VFCPKCGKENPDSTKFCDSCGANLEYWATPNLAPPKASGDGDPMSFGKSISTCFSKFFVFSGRASRPEYWWFYLFTILLSWGSILVDPSQVLSLMVNLILLFPVLAAGTRRLHDTNRSGWWQLLYITIIGTIPVIVWMASKGSDQDNQYGGPV
jgi:uncharacterized membrane protein YhaH (DUF805 family)